MSRERQIGICPFSDEQCRLSYKPEYTERKSPVRDSKQRLVVARAPEISYECGSCLWDVVNRKMNSEIDRTDAQVVVLTPHSDMTRKLYVSLQDSPLGKYKAATTEEKRWSDNSLYIELTDEAPEAQSVYIVASTLNEDDCMRAERIADHYKTVLNAKYATLVAPFFPTREDKNVDSKGNYRPNTINLHSDLRGVSSVFDRMICYETHSSAAQTYAAEMGMPLLPLSPFIQMIDHVKKEGVMVKGKKNELTPDNTVVIGPDKGRNLAARRIAEHLRSPYVSFNKVRISGHDVIVYELTPEEQEIVRGNIAITYDDEAQSMKTMGTIGGELQRYGAESMVACLAHLKLTDKWEDVARNPFFAKILGTDSRQPIGNIRMAGNIEIMSLEPLCRQVICDDIKGMNFWEDRESRKMILQPHNSEIKH